MSDKPDFAAWGAAYFPAHRHLQAQGAKCAKDAWEAGYAAAQASRGEGQQQWRPISEARLPEPEERPCPTYLVTDGQWVGTAYWYPDDGHEGWYETGTHWTDYGADQLHGLTHFMLLPPPPPAQE